MKTKGNKKILGLYANMMCSDEQKGMFYGMTISYDSKKLNPLHPVIAAMITAGEIRLPDEFTIIVYPYAHKAFIDDDYAEEYKKEIIEGITQIREEQHLPSVTYRANGSESSDIQNFTNNSEYSISFNETGENTQCAVIPVQLATSGVTYPYYGLIMSDRTHRDSYLSTNLYPCLSGNIDVSTNRNGQTCVGELSNSVFASLYVLSNMNINSLYYTDIYTSETLTFVHACQSVSAAFISAWAGIVPDPIEEEVEEDVAEVEAVPYGPVEPIEVEDDLAAASEVEEPMISPEGELVDEQLHDDIADVLSIVDINGFTDHAITDTAVAEVETVEEAVEEVGVDNNTVTTETEWTVNTDLATGTDQTGIVNFDRPIA